MNKIINVFHCKGVHIRSMKVDTPCIIIISQYVEHNEILNSDLYCQLWWCVGLPAQWPQSRETPDFEATRSLLPHSVKQDSG